MTPLDEFKNSNLTITKDQLLARKVLWIILKSSVLQIIDDEWNGLESEGIHQFWVKLYTYVYRAATYKN